MKKRMEEEALKNRIDDLRNQVGDVSGGVGNLYAYVDDQDSLIEELGQLEFVAREAVLQIVELKEDLEE